MSAFAMIRSNMVYSLLEAILETFSSGSDKMVRITLLMSPE